MRVSLDGTTSGQHTLANLRAFLAACEHLGIPDEAKVTGKTKLTGSGPLKTLTAEWAGSTVVDVPAESPTMPLPRSTPVAP